VTTRRARMTRRWMSWNSGAEEITIAADATARVLLPTLLEAEIGREIEQYTVVRTIMDFSLRAAGGVSSIAVGLIVHNENVVLGQIDPTDDPHADWMYHEQFSVNTLEHLFHRDVAGKRMSRGHENELFLYIRNRETGAAVMVFFAGRTLILTT